jgi:hypothetical protein
MQQDAVTAIQSVLFPDGELSSNGANEEGEYGGDIEKP